MASQAFGSDRPAPQPSDDLEQTGDPGVTSWYRKKMNKRSPPVELPKTAVAKSRFTMISWHFWTITPCLITAVLLSLNISEYSIGREIGSDPDKTGIIISIIQLCSKIHEIMMVIGLLGIAQQAIQRGLITPGGTLLGLLGVEGSLTNILFIFSKQFRVAFSYSLSGGPRQNNIRKIVAVIFVVCSLCTVVGPASAVLMVPRVAWFYEQSLFWNFKSDVYSSHCYPYVMVDPRLGNADITMLDYYYQDPFHSPYSKYWQDISTRESEDYTTGDKRYTHLSHHFIDEGPVTVNSTSSSNVTVDVTDWRGKTNFATVLQTDSVEIFKSLTDYKPKRPFLSPRKFSVEITGVQSETICRPRKKLECERAEFCFESVAAESSADLPIMDSSQLLLLYDGLNPSSPNAPPGSETFFDDDSDSGARDVKVTRIWITEGYIEKNQGDFFDSIFFVLEFPQTEPDQRQLIVCSTVAVLKLVTATSSRQAFDPDQVEPHGKNLPYFDSIHARSVRPSIGGFLYHRSWLDSLHTFPGQNVTIEDMAMRMEYGVPAPRGLNKLPDNPELVRWGQDISRIHNIQTKAGVHVTKAMTYEVALGGAFISILSRLHPSSTSYSSASKFSESLLNGSSSPPTYHKMTYPQELLTLEPMMDCHYPNTTIQVYQHSYGYQWLSSSKILSMLILLAHAVVSMLGSFWQLSRGSIIKAWESVSEFGTLCLGSDPEKALPTGAYAGPISKATLGSLVEVRESNGLGGGVQRVRRLELAVLTEEESSTHKDTVKIQTPHGAVPSKFQDTDVAQQESGDEPSKGLDAISSAVSTPSSSVQHRTIQDNKTESKVPL